MNRRQDQLHQELRVVENAQDNVHALMTRSTWDAKERAHLQAQLDVLERRRATLQHLLFCP